MKFTVLIFILFLIISCTPLQPKGNLEYTIINNKSIFEYKTELETYTTINELRKKNIDFVAYKDYSVGSIRLLNSEDLNNCTNCLDKFSIFLLWEENEIEYLQIFDNCGNFYPVKLINRDILKFTKQNLETLNAERVKFYQENKNTVVLTYHSRFKKFLISVKDREIYNYFDTYNLKSNSEKPNLNYLFNQNLKLIRLNSMIEDEIKIQNELNNFKRDLTECR